MRSGFTLIEVLIVIVILGIMMGVGSVRFREFERRQAVVSAKRQLLSDVRAAQSDAAAGRKPPGCTGTLQAYGFEVVRMANPARYRTFARCGQGVSTADFVTKTAELPAGITLNVSGVNPVLFKSVSGGTNLTGVSSVTIEVKGSGTSTIETLTINASGEVR